jgi:hypothetical protein
MAARIRIAGRAEPRVGGRLRENRERVGVTAEWRNVASPVQAGDGDRGDQACGAAENADQKQNLHHRGRDVTPIAGAPGSN